MPSLPSLLQTPTPTPTPAPTPAPTHSPMPAPIPTHPHILPCLRLYALLQYSVNSSRTRRQCHLLQVPCDVSSCSSYVLLLSHCAVFIRQKSIASISSFSYPPNFTFQSIASISSFSYPPNCIFQSQDQSNAQSRSQSQSQVHAQALYKSCLGFRIASRSPAHCAWIGKDASAGPHLTQPSPLPCPDPNP